MAPKPATIDDLLGELQKINIALKGGNLGDRSSQTTTPLGRSGSDSGPSAEELDRANKAIREKIALMREQEELGDTLTSRQELEIAQLERRAFLLEKAAAAGTPGMQEKIIGLYDRTTNSQDKLNKAMDVGSSQFKTLTKGMFHFGGAAEEVAGHIPHTAEQLQAFTMDAKDFIKTGKIFSKILHKVAGDTLNLSVALEKVNAELSRSHGIAQDSYGTMSKQAKVTRATERELAILGVTAQNASAAQRALIDDMSSFSQLSEAQKKDLTKQVAVMQELNVSVGTSVEMFDVATKALGMGVGQMGKLSQELKNTADSLGMPLSRVTQDFVAVSKQLSFYGEDVIDVFKDLEKQAKATGLSMQQLVSIGGDAFDTFDGAATKVGRLNAILGGPYLNSIDMLNATEAERLEMLQASMDASGTQYQDLGKFQQKAIADALGVTTEEANRLFGNLSAAEELEIKHKEEMAETARKAQTSMAKLANAFNHLLIAMDPVFSLFETFAELVNKGVNTSIGKGIGRVLLYTGAFVGLGKSLLKVATNMRKLGAITKSVRLMKAGSKLRNFATNFSSLRSLLSTGWKVIRAPFQWLRAAPTSISTAFGNVFGSGGTVATWFGSLFGSGGTLAGLWATFTGGVTYGLGTIVAGVTALVGNVIGVFMGLFKTIKGMWRDMIADGADFGKQAMNVLLFIPKLILGALTGIADAWGSLISLIPGSEVLFGEMGFRRSFDYLYGSISGDTATKVNDAIITADGKVIEPNPQDTIIAAKPGGPLGDLLGGLGAGITAPIDALGSILGLAGMGPKDGPAAAPKDGPAAAPTTQQPVNQTINVNVRIGERELKDIIQEVTRESIGAFANA